MSPADVAVAADDLREALMARGQREAALASGGRAAVEITATGARVQLVDAFSLGDLADELAADLKRLTA